MTPQPPLGKSRALWNRTHAALESDEVLAQVLDRGSIADWRAVYRAAEHDPALRTRVKRLLVTVPLPLPHFWLAALVSLGEDVDWTVPVPDYYEGTSI
jgi:hypothetical protein